MTAPHVKPRKTFGPHGNDGFDSAAAVTRSLLGWGVLAGPIYLVTGLILAVTRDGFDLTEHQLSRLMLGDHGWVQRGNLLLSGLLCLIAAWGFHRAMNRTGSSRATTVLLSTFALGLIGSGIFAPDPMAGFHPGADEDVTTAGLLHLVFGVIQFTSMAAACFTAARWLAGRGELAWSRRARIAGVAIGLGFLGGGALAQFAAGVAFLWAAVVVEYAALAMMSWYLYGTVPHPDEHRREATE